MSELDITKLLITKFGMDKIEGLLLDNYSLIENKKRRIRQIPSPTDLPEHRRSDLKYLFIDYIGGDGTEYWCDPEYVVSALNDAIEEMSYSNWHCSRFEIAINVLMRFCQEHNIPLKISNTEKDDV